VGIGAVQEIIRARSEKGRFESLTDFCRKVDSGVLHKKVLESLILSGAFDSLGYRRRALLENYEKVTVPVLADRRAEAVGQESFFGGASAELLAIDESVLAGAEFEKPDLLRQEKEMLGQFVTDHPLLAIKDRLAAQTDLEMVDVPTLGDGDVVTVAGIVAAIGRKYTKRGEPYAIFRLEDLTGGVGIVAFPSVFDKASPIVAPDAVVVVRGRADLRGRELQLVALDIREPDLSAEGETAASSAGRGSGSKDPSDPLVVDVPAASCTSGLISRLKELFGLHPGDLPVVVRLVTDGAIVRLRLGTERSVDGSAVLLSELRRLLGPEAVRISLIEPAGDLAGVR
jgi:DNA polymerase-3 subunit alpha